MKKLGWDSILESHFQPYKEQNYGVGRVAIEHTNIYRIYTQWGELIAETTGKMRYAAVGREDFPAVGDWVIISPRPQEGRATIHGILPRKSKFSRKVAGKVTEEQILATNIDTLFLFNALNQDFNLRRIERYLIMAWESGANPVIVLSKADLCHDAEEKLMQVQEIAIGVPIHVISAIKNEGVEVLRQYLGEGKTIALLGSSGVGKSTLINRLMGEDVMKTQSVREGDDRGRHTTTHREMILLPEGGIIIDTPGMRELQLWDTDGGLHDTFEEIEVLAENCFFTDCKHKNEPNCAVRLAIEEGHLDESRFENYKKMQKELRYLETKQNKQARALEKKNVKTFAKQVREAAKKR